MINRKPTPDYDMKILLHRGVAGQIVKWHANKGVGAVYVGTLDEEIAFTQKQLTAIKQRPPRKNEAVTVYAKYDDTQRCWLATQITSPLRNQLADAHLAQEQALFRPMKTQLQWAIPVVMVWWLLVALGSWKMAAACVFISAITMGLYAWDKSCAIHQKSRVPEMTLHALGLLGGWGGALWAQYAFRHKTQKQPFVTLFWVTVGLNIAVLGYLIFSGSLRGVV